jgi:hypothetical protein
MFGPTTGRAQREGVQILLIPMQPTRNVFHVQALMGGIPKVTPAEYWVVQPEHLFYQINIGVDQFVNITRVRPEIKL